MRVTHLRGVELTDPALAAVAGRPAEHVAGARA